MAEKQLWLEPDYFADFHCKGGECRNCCCSGWDIAVSMEDYFQLIGLECGEELHHRLECAFRTPPYPTPQRYRLISPNWLGRCPLQQEDGLCALQCACGEAVLPEVCRVYPRSFKREGKNLQACCSGSCEAVIEMLMQEEQLSFKLVEMDARVEIGEDAGENIAGLIRQCVETLQNRARPLQLRIESICAALDAGEAFLQGEEGFGLLTEVLAEMCSESRNLSVYGEPVLDRYAGGAWEEYCADLRDFEAHWPGWQRIFENVLVNHIVSADFPQTDSRLSMQDSCAGLCLLFSLMRVLCAGHMAVHSGAEALADVISGLFHPVEHGAFYFNARVRTGGRMIMV